MLLIRLAVCLQNAAARVELSVSAGNVYGRIAQAIIQLLFSRELMIRSR